MPVHDGECDLHRQEALQLQRIFPHASGDRLERQRRFAERCLGRENRGSHYEISLTPQRFHRLMLPLLPDHRSRTLLFFSIPIDTNVIYEL